MTASSLLWSLGAGGAVVLVLMTAAALRARAIRRIAVVDVAWGFGFVAVAVVTAVVATMLDDGSLWRRWLLVALVAVWGLRLTWHTRAQLGPGEEDSRYEDAVGGTLNDVGMGTVARKVFVVQALGQWFVAGPVMVAVVSEAPWWPAVVAGVVVWAVGLGFEVVGDRQLATYKAEPKESRPKVMDRGLWGWTRHPNYFGDATVWWGLWLVGGLGSGWELGLATVLCPALMTFFLVQVTGAKPLEKKMMQREGFPEYAARTSMFLPLPPGSRAARTAG